ncbi:MAG: TIGR01459 family HAD-type hydrolase [Pseudomonadota bacterium]
MTNHQTQWLEKLGSTLDRYDALVLDQWGVLHNGQAPYPGVIAALDALQAAGKPFVILSNSGKRSGLNQQRLAALGFAADVCARILTSGELTWRALAGHTDELAGIADQTCFLISQPGETRLLDETDWQVTTIDKASVILVAGLPDQPSLADYEPGLRQGLERGLPLICANLDFDALYGDATIIGPGRLAQWYEDQGGQVIRFGKPMANAFAGALAMVGQPAPSRCLMVGDSLFHDIAGAAKAGLDTLLLTQGIHRAALAGHTTDTARMAALSKLAEPTGVMPTYLMDSFVI